MAVEYDDGDHGVVPPYLMERVWKRYLRPKLYDCALRRDLCRSTLSPPGDRLETLFHVLWSIIPSRQGCQWVRGANLVKVSPRMRWKALDRAAGAGYNEDGDGLPADVLVEVQEKCRSEPSGAGQGGNDGPDS